MIRKKLLSDLTNYYRGADQYAQRLALHTDEACQDYLSFITRFVSPGARILDVGCGTGQSCALMARQGYQAVGIDLSEHCIAQAGEPRRQLSRFVCGNILELPFAGESFDCVGIYQVIEHIPDIPRLLSEMVRVLRKGGRLIILSPNLLSPFNIIVPFCDRLRGRRPAYLFGIKNPLRAALLLVRHTAVLMRKICVRGYSFTERVPVLENRIDYIADNDAVYLSCPVDFRKYFHQADKLRVINYQRFGKIGRLLPDFSTGIYVVVEKEVN